MDDSSNQLQSFLAHQDCPCPSCDYNLCGLKGDICPECSQRLTLRVGLFEPRQRAFIAALVGLAMGTGFQGLLLLYFCIRVIGDRGMRSDGLHFLIMTAPAFVVEGVALLMLVRKRRVFQRRPDEFKHWIVFACWTVTLAGFTLFTLFIK